MCLLRTIFDVWNFFFFQFTYLTYALKSYTLHNVMMYSYLYNRIVGIDIHKSNLGEIMVKYWWVKIVIRLNCDVTLLNLITIQRIAIYPILSMHLFHRQLRVLSNNRYNDKFGVTYSSWGTLHVGGYIGLGIFPWKKFNLDENTSLLFSFDENWFYCWELFHHTI